ncbi:EF-hand calcium-binding domain-containing protein 4B isoform X2 [Leptopilina heterotoma]|uniref:EF-hand calcium-binding domain-containing protein 4B isoform X2 n=1 Tax=Leptopilina heterotoma TaxID=63436 RepID=UPI001CA8A7BD|nr:EF-hand calcium-binding domain-containing protein 4B isoform X2 [Leptopilina heterotoma]
MDHVEKINPDGSSPDTLIGQSSPEDDRKRQMTSFSAESLNTAATGDSSSSLETIVGVGMEAKKKGRFGSLKSSFRKEGGLFRMKKKKKKHFDDEPSHQYPHSEQSSKDMHINVSLVPFLAFAPHLNGDDEDPQRILPEEKKNQQQQVQHEDVGSKSRQKKPKKAHSLVRKLSLSKFKTLPEPETRHTPEGGDSSRSLSQSSQESTSRLDSSPTLTPRKQESVVQEKWSTCSLPGATQEKSTVSEREGKKGEQQTVQQKSEKLIEKPVSTITVVQRKSPSLTIKISNLQERTLKLQQYDEDATRRNLDHHPRPEFKEEKSKKTARHISVRKFDTFSTFEGTFDEDTGVGYLAGIEEDYRESCEKQTDSFASLQEDMAHAISENPEKSRSISQDSASSQNNVPNSGLGEKREHLYKILVIGELGAGKTSIIKRYVHQFFSQHYRATIGVDFALKVLNWDPHTIIRLQLWDIAGQERFGNMTRVYYKEAVGAFIVFDVTRSATLEAVVKWKQDLDSKVQLPDGSPIPCVLLANKCDQQKEGLVNTPTKMDEYCKEKNFAGWFETSAKENINIEEAARFLVNKILQNDQILKGSGSQDQTDGERFALNQSPTSSKKSCAC